MRSVIVDRPAVADRWPRPPPTRRTPPSRRPSPPSRLDDERGAAPRPRAAHRRARAQVRDAVPRDRLADAARRVRRPRTRRRQAGRALTRAARPRARWARRSPPRPTAGERRCAVTDRDGAVRLPALPELSRVPVGRPRLRGPARRRSTRRVDGGARRGAARRRHRRSPSPPVTPAPEPTGYRVQTKLMVGAYAARRRARALRAGQPSHPRREPLPAARPAAAARDPGDRATRSPREHVPLHGRGRPGVRYVLVRASVAEARVLVTLVSSRGAAPERGPSRTPLADGAAARRPAREREHHAPATSSSARAPSASGARRCCASATATSRSPPGPTAFVQANTRMAARDLRARSRAAAALDPRAPRVLDLYCGVGGIALTLAPRAAAVLGIEEVEAAVRGGARQRGARPASRTRASSPAGSRTCSRRIDEPVDVVTMNPPRKGCAPARACAALARLAPAAPALSLVQSGVVRARRRRARRRRLRPRRACSRSICCPRPTTSSCSATFRRAIPTDYMLRYIAKALDNRRYA